MSREEFDIIKTNILKACFNYHNCIDKSMRKVAKSYGHSNKLREDPIYHAIRELDINIDSLLRQALDSAYINID